MVSVPLTIPQDDQEVTHAARPLVTDSSSDDDVMELGGPRVNEGSDIFPKSSSSNPSMAFDLAGEDDEEMEEETQPH